MRGLIYLCTLCILSACSLAGPALGAARGSTPTPSAPALQTTSSSAAVEESSETEILSTPSTAEPSRDPTATLAPLTSEAVESCPVSRPNGKSPPDETASGEYFGNEAGTLYTVLWPGGFVLFTPGGAGHIAADGSLTMKWPWFRTVEGDVVIGGRRLDAVSPPMPAIILRGEPDGYGETGFHPSGLTWPGEGCWEVTARVGTESLTFVTLVARAPFSH